MCDASIIAGVGIALSVAGTAYSASQQAAASSAQNAANDAATASNNRAFWLRNSNSADYLAEQGQVQRAAMEASQSAFDAQRERQSSALADRQKVIDQENQTAQGIRDQADQAQNTLLASTSGEALSGAQTAEQTARAQQFAPISQNIQTASPLGSPDDGSPTKQAFASRLAEAADAVRDYGKRVAAVASYTAPLNTVQHAIEANSTALMPVAAANQLLQSGQSIRLLPSQQDYTLAGNEGSAAKDLIASQQQGDLNVAKTRYDGQESWIDLQQNDTTTNAQNAATRATNDAKVNQSIGSLISSVGNLAAYGSQRFGTTTSSPSADALLGGQGNGSIVGVASPTASGAARTFSLTR